MDSGSSIHDNLRRVCEGEPDKPGRHVGRYGGMNYNQYMLNQYMLLPSVLHLLASRGSEGNIFNNPVVSQPRAYDRAQPCLHDEHREAVGGRRQDRGRVFWG